MSTPVGLPKATARVDSRLKLTFGKLVSKATIGATTTGTRGDKSPPNFWVGGTGNVLVPLNFLVNLNFQYVHVVCVNVIYFKWYDGASNMAGKFNGAQALIAGKQSSR